MCSWELHLPQHLNVIYCVMSEQAIQKAQTQSASILGSALSNPTPWFLANYYNYKRFFCKSLKAALLSRSCWTPASFVAHTGRRCGWGKKKLCVVPNPPGALICSCWFLWQHSTLSSHFSCCSSSMKLLMPRNLWELTVGTVPTVKSALGALIALFSLQCVAGDARAFLLLSTKLSDHQ